MMPVWINHAVLLRHFEHIVEVFLEKDLEFRAVGVMTFAVVGVLVPVV